MKSLIGIVPIIVFLIARFSMDFPFVRAMALSVMLAMVLSFLFRGDEESDES